jgi:hypothetical protein
MSGVRRMRLLSGRGYGLIRRSAVGLAVAVGVIAAGVAVLSSAAQADPVNGIATFVGLSSSDNPSAFGDPVTLTATVTAVQPVTGGTVTFTIDGVAGTPVPLDAGGQATLVIATLTAGNHPWSASYSGTSVFAAADSPPTEQQVGSTPTLITLAPLSPSAYGQAVTFTATVSATVPVTVGSVFFTVDGRDPSSPQPVDGSGQVQFTPPTLAPGDHSVVAHYLGTAEFQDGDSAPGTQSVGPAGVDVALTSSLNPSGLDDEVVFTATVTGPVGTPTGSLTFDIDGVTSAPVPLGSAGSAQLATSGLSGGTHSIFATYLGSASYTSGSSSTLTQTVDLIPTGTVLVADPNPSVVGQPVSFTATVSPAPAGGTVAFADAAGTIPGCGARPVLAGVATCSTAFAAVGSYAVTAIYSGDPSSAGSSSDPVTQVVDPAATVVAPITPVAGLRFGKDATYTVSVTTAYGPVAEGSVTLSVDGTASGAPVELGADGTATITVAGLAVGTHQLHASYAGTDNYLPSDADGTQDVAPATTDLALSADPAHPTDADAITVTATVTVGDPEPVTVGAVTFSLDGKPAGAAVTLSSDGTAVLNLDALPAGAHTLTASYSGSEDYQSSTATLTVSVTAHASGSGTGSSGGSSGTGSSSGSSSSGTTSTSTLADTGADPGPALWLGGGLLVAGLLLLAVPRRRRG